LLIYKGFLGVCAETVLKARKKEKHEKTFRYISMTYKLDENTYGYFEKMRV